MPFCNGAKLPAIHRIIRTRRDRHVHGVLDMAVHGVLDMAVHGVLDMAVYGVLDMAVYGVLTKVITNLTQLFQNSTRLCIVFIYLIHYRVNMHVSLAIHSLDRKNNKLIMLTNPPQHYRNKIFVSHRFAGENHCRHCRC